MFVLLPAGAGDTKESLMMKQEVGEREINPLDNSIKLTGAGLQKSQAADPVLGSPVHRDVF